MQKLGPDVSVVKSNRIFTKKKKKHDLEKFLAMDIPRESHWQDLLNYMYLS